jgi:hypothetical protein
MWGPNIRYLIGVLKCNAIDRLAREAIDGHLSALNPFLLIDPNRRTGLVKDHPFTLALYGPAYQVLEVVLNRIQDTRDDQMLEIGNAKDVVQSLNDLVSDLLPSENVLYTWRDKATHSNLTAMSQQLQNVHLDSSFLGLSWEEIQNLTQKKFLDSSAAPSSFKISFTNDPNLRDPYQILYLPGQINLKINALDHSIKDYVEIKDGAVHLTNSGKALTVVGSMVLDATNNLLVRKQILSGSTSTLDLNAYNEYLYHYQTARKSIASSIMGRIGDGIKSLKSNDTNAT